MLTKEKFESIVKEVTKNLTATPQESMVAKYVGWTLFAPRNASDQEQDRDYTIRGFTQCLEWDEPQGHLGPSCKIIQVFDGAKLVKYWWHEKPTVLVDMTPTLQGVFELYNWMLAKGYKVNKF